MLITLHDSVTYDDRRKSYEWLKHQALKCNFISLKVLENRFVLLRSCIDASETHIHVIKVTTIELLGCFFSEKNDVVNFKETKLNDLQDVKISLIWPQREMYNKNVKANY